MKINLKNNKYVEVTIRKSENNLYQYYLGDLLIGIYDVDSMKDNKFFAIDLEKNNTIENELSAQSKEELQQIVQTVKEQIDELSLKDIQKEGKIQEEIDKYLQELGINKDNVKNIVEMDLEREEEKKPKASEEKEIEDERKEDKEEQEEKNSRITTKDINIKQEVKLDERANEYNLRKWLGNKVPNQFTKIGVIESNAMSKMTDRNGNNMKTSTTRYDLVVIGKDGQVEPLKNYIPELEQNNVSGNNPTQEQYQIDTDGSVEKDAVLSEYRIGSNIIQLDKNMGDHIELNIGKYGPNSNDLVTTQMRDENTQFATDIEVRKAANSYYGGIYQTDESVAEAKEHEETSCEPEEMTYEEIDGDEQTGHKDITNEDIEQYVEEIMQDEDISDVLTEREVRERLIKNFRSKSSESNIENDKISTVESKEMAEKIKEDTKEELEEDSSHFRDK